VGTASRPRGKRCSHDRGAPPLAPAAASVAWAPARLAASASATACLRPRPSFRAATPRSNNSRART
jgi:hypothetical protein